MTNLDLLREQMSSIDPIHNYVSVSRASSPEGRALFERIIVTPRTISPQKAPANRPFVFGRRWLLVGVTTMALVLAGSIALWPGLGAAPAAAATPPLLPISTTERSDGVPILRQIAATAEALPDEPVTGSYRYVRTENWSLNSAVTNEGATSVLSSRQSESWIAPDGSGRFRTVPGSNLVNRVASQETLNAALGKKAIRDTSLISNQERRLIDLDQLAFDNPKAFASSVDSTVNVNLPSDTLLVEAIGKLFGSQPLPPVVRSKVWQLLAETTGVNYLGQTQDRIGRVGAVVSVEDNGTAHGLAGRNIFVIDPESGQLLESDHVFTESGRLNIDVPAVVGLSVYLDRGYTTQPSGRPTR